MGENGFGEAPREDKHIKELNSRGSVHVREN